MLPQLHKIWLVVLFACLAVVSGCAAFKPRPMEETAFQVRSQTQSEDKVRVTAAVLSAEESKAAFGVTLYKKGIQPIRFCVYKSGFGHQKLKRRPRRG